ncbi:hypothetical protein ATANTOWER_027896, partial [Ataeniobius toweri]|nr:hypothetical protein [Ataeniobius toweri]
MRAILLVSRLRVNTATFNSPEVRVVWAGACFQLSDEIHPGQVAQDNFCCRAAVQYIFFLFM